MESSTASAKGSTARGAKEEEEEVQLASGGPKVSEGSEGKAVEEGKTTVAGTAGEMVMESSEGVEDREEVEVEVEVTITTASE